ncbi:MAG: hypothetical protein IAG13_00180, partial [Deltaproteobacteria bacterium]|nr:hypothetical protein [Nannocystaceae bacterium]
MSGRLHRLGRELFGDVRPPTRGERLAFRGFELLVVLWTLQAAWDWAPTIARIEAVVLPLGIFEHV